MTYEISSADIQANKEVSALEGFFTRVVTMLIAGLFTLGIGAIVHGLAY